MTEYELLRIIDFLERLRLPFDDGVPGARPDGSFNMIFYLMRCHLKGQRVIKSSLASASGLPYVTAMRHINQLIDDGTFEVESRTETGRSFYVVPSPGLIDAFVEYARRAKATIGQTLGSIESGSEADDYYFGGSNFSGSVIPPLSLLERKAEGAHDLRFLFRDDNYFEALRNTWTDLRATIASTRNFDLVDMPTLYERIVENARRDVSEYDVICVNMPWAGSLAEAGYVRPITDLVAESRIQPLDFSPIVWDAGFWKGEQYGLPIYSTMEILLARRDLFDEAGLALPRTFDQVIEAARRLHAPDRDFYGIAWNCAAGMPIANTFLILLGCCNSSVLNIPRRRMHTPLDTLSQDQRVARVNTDQGLEVLDFMHRMVEVSPPDVLEMDWDRRVETFLKGRSALAYSWSMHAALMEYDVASRVRRRVAYLPQPKGRAGLHATPVGGFFLMVPSNLPDERAKLAFEAIAWMASPQAMKEHVTNGFPVAPRFSVAADPEAAASSPIVGFVDQLVRNGQVYTWQRPAVPEYHDIETILGAEVHRAIRGEVSDKEALGRAQRRIEAVMAQARPMPDLPARAARSGTR